MNKKNLIKILPWWFMVGTKICLSFIPNKHILFRKINLFKHGHMMNSGYAIDVYKRYMDNVTLKKNFTLLELGPGDSVSTAIIAYANGAKKSFLVDNGDYAIKDMIYYHNLIKELKSKKNMTFLLNCNDFYEMLKKINCIYLTNGLDSLKKIKSEQIDFICSNAVLEHIELNDFKETFKELFRISKVGGNMYHCVDLQDHIKYSLNSLRFSKKIWETNLIKNSGFYTNRLRFLDIIDIVEKVGFEIVYAEKKKWNKLPIKNTNLNKDFKFRKDLDILGFSFVTLK